MKIIIVGGGKLGKDIADNMLERKYDVRLIEKNRAKCIELANDLDVEMVQNWKFWRKQEQKMQIALSLLPVVTRIIW